MRLTRRLTPAMADKGEGYHINISSSAGKHPSPKQCAYSAAKWGMTGFALSSAKVRFESWMRILLQCNVPTRQPSGAWLALLCHQPRWVWILSANPFPKQCAYSAAKRGMTGFVLSSAKVGLKSWVHCQCWQTTLLKAMCWFSSQVWHDRLCSVISKGWDLNPTCNVSAGTDPSPEHCAYSAATWRWQAVLFSSDKITLEAWMDCQAVAAPVECHGSVCTWSVYVQAACIQCYWTGSAMIASCCQSRSESFWSLPL